MAKKKRIPHKFHPWIHARREFKLSDAQIQMARELGLSPKRFGRYADNSKEPWKLPLAEFIEAQYLKQFGKERPNIVKTMEQIAEEHVAKRAARKAENARIASANETAADSVSEITAAPETDTPDESTTDAK